MPDFTEGLALVDAEELRPWAGRQIDDRAVAACRRVSGHALLALDRHPKEVLIELGRSLDVRDADRDVVERADGDWRGCLCGSANARRDDERRQRHDDVAARKLPGFKTFQQIIDRMSHVRFSLETRRLVSRGPSLCRKLPPAPDQSDQSDREVDTWSHGSRFRVS